jgi:hypothetical protein
MVISHTTFSQLSGNVFFITLTERFLKVQTWLHFISILEMFCEHSPTGLTLGMFPNSSEKVKKQRSSVGNSVLQRNNSYRFPRGSI